MEYNPNINRTFTFENKVYRKVAIREEDSCKGCITEHGSKLCYEAGDCSGIILEKYRDWIKMFKDL